MTIPLVILAFSLALGSTWLAWRYIRLRRSLDDLTARVRAATRDGDHFIEDVDELANLSSAINSLASTLTIQLSSIDTERARLAAVLEQMTDGVLMTDEAGRVTFVNPAAERLFERAETSLGASMTEVLRHHELVQAWRRSQQTGEIQTASVELPRRRQYLHLVVIPDRHTPGGSLLLAQDLTRIRRLETVRQDFISNLSHELRTPLASLKALTETLQDGALDDPPAAHRFLKRIETEVDALAQMAAELLQLSRIESDQMTLDQRAVAPLDLLSMAEERMRLQAQRAGLTLHVDCPSNLPAVRADAARLGQVLVNLIHNAIKFTPAGGVVTLLAEASSGVVRFGVRDTGAGIPADDLPRIFERFYKTDRARSSGGTGLGLSIARHIVEAHDGKIWAESLEGAGSTIYFTIPISQ
ncbi:MAG: cell wall metabolism sensor histidine kinase WalK [Chloroflexi bacterium]|nr:cell wall metabolism sensor histidine kinase WalK [Chloroflexota bacterium]